MKKALIRTGKHLSVLTIVKTLVAQKLRLKPINYIHWLKSAPYFVATQKVNQTKYAKRDYFAQEFESSR